MKDPRDIIIRPVVTEKSSGRMQDGKYTFAVAMDANRTEIKEAVESIFKVRVTNVNTVRMQGKLRRMGRFVGRKPSWKKAIVTLAPGQKIELFEGM
ncbi:MAG: 50S ribosomal protein L23 [Bacillota bacterium]